MCIVQYLEEGYICRPCQRSGEKLHKIHDKLAAAWQQFRAAVSPQLFISMDARSLPPSNTPPISSTIPNPKPLRLESHTSDTTPVKTSFR